MKMRRMWLMGLLVVGLVAAGCGGQKISEQVEVSEPAASQNASVETVPSEQAGTSDIPSSTL